jgi:ankyrin repeat protein
MSTALEYFVNYDKIPLSKRIAMTNVKDQTHRNMNKDEEFELQGRHINWKTGINIPDLETGLTPLMLSAIHGRKDLVIALLERGAEVEYSEVQHGRTALHYACKAGNAEVVSELLKRGALVNAKDNHSKTPLLIASKGGFSDVVKHLLPRGAGVNNTDDQGLSALHYAAKFGHFEVLDILINHRGAIELRDNVEGFAPIHYAAQYGRKECVKCLLDYGGKVNRRTSKEKLTPLILASREGNKSIVSLLISRGADVRLFDIYGWAALHFASSWGRKDTAHILIVDGKANVNQRAARVDNEMTGTPPLCVAAKGSQVEVVKLLLQYGADINLSDIATGHAALAYSAGAGMSFSVQTLIEYGANINRRSEVTGHTALMEATANGRHSCITKLLDAYADLNILDYSMRSCWEIAVNANHQEVLLGAMLQSSRRAKVNALPWLQMHFHQLTEYHRWDEYHTHDEYDLLYDRTFGKPSLGGIDGEDEDDDTTEIDEEDSAESKEQRMRDDLFERQRQLNKAKKSKQQVKYMKRAFATAGQYLKAYLFGREGCFSGLFSLPGDCDVYLVYNLMMIFSTCVQPNHVPEDTVIFQGILSKVGNMLVSIFQADNAQQLPTLIDMMIMGKEPVERILPELLASTSYHNATRLLSSSFVYGPWAMFLESFAYDFETLFYHVAYKYGQPTAKYTHPSHGLFRSQASNIFLQPRIKQLVHNVFHTWDKEHGLIVDGYGYYSEKILYLRYSPVTMYYLEGVGRALLVFFIIFYTQQFTPKYGSYASYLYPPRGNVGIVVDAASSGITIVEYILGGIIFSHVLYEIGLMEEKRWSTSPAMVFMHKTLEQFRWKLVYNHFMDDPYKILDGLALLLGVTWLVCRFIVFVPGMPQNTSINFLSAGVQALTLCLIPQTLALARYFGTMFPEFGKVCIGIFFLIYDLWPYLLIYMLVGLAVGSAIAGILTLSPLGAFQYMLSFLFFNGSSLTGNGNSLDMYITRTADEADVNPVYTTIMIIMVALCFPTAGIIFLSIIQRIFSRQQSGGTNSSGAGSNGTSHSDGPNPVEYNGYNAGPGSSPEDVIEKYYYYWHCRRIQEHTLVLEKSALCMLPPVLNLLSLIYYVPHVYLGWRARLRFDVDITRSWGGMCTDGILFALVLLPCAFYEYYLKNIYGIHRIVTQNHESERADMSPESNFGRLMSILYLPFGIFYTIVCLIYKFTNDTAPRLIVKTRLADGRCRMSRGLLRDIYEANILSRLEDYRLHGHLRFYASTHPLMNREYEYNAMEQKTIAVANLKMKPSTSAAAAAYEAMGGVVNAKKPFSTANFSMNIPQYTEEIYAHEFSEFQSSKTAHRQLLNADDDMDFSLSQDTHARFSQSTKYKERGGRYLQYDEDDRKHLQAIEDGLEDDIERTIGTEHPRVPRSVTLFAGAEDPLGSLSAWLPFRRRHRPSDYVGKKIRIVPQRPYLQLRLLRTQISPEDPTNLQPLPDNGQIQVPQHLSLDAVLGKMAKELRLRKWKAHQEMLLRTKQVVSRHNLFVGALDTVSVAATDGEGLAHNPLEPGDDECDHDDYIFDGQRKKPGSAGDLYSKASSDHHARRGEKLMDKKEAKHPDHFRRPRLIFQSLLQQFRKEKKGGNGDGVSDGQEETALDAMAERDLSMYQPGIETERQWALLAYEHDLVTTHHLYASKRSQWQSQRRRRAQQPMRSRFGAHGSLQQQQQQPHLPSSVSQKADSSRHAWIGKDVSVEDSRLQEDDDEMENYLQMQSTWSLSPTLLEEQTHLHFQPTSLYFQPFQHPPIFTAKEREQIFRHALPDYFPSDFARAMLDVDLNVTLLQEMLPWLLEKQVQTLDQRLSRQLQQQGFQQQQQQPFMQMMGPSQGSMMMTMVDPNGSFYGDPHNRSFVSFSPNLIQPNSSSNNNNNNSLESNQIMPGPSSRGNLRSFLSSSFVTTTPGRSRSPNAVVVEPAGGQALRPMGEEDVSVLPPFLAQQSSTMVPGGIMYREDDTLVGEEEDDQDGDAVPTVGMRRPLSSSKRSVSFYPPLENAEPSVTSADGGGQGLPSTATSRSKPTLHPNHTSSTPPPQQHGGIPSSTPITTGGGRIRHDNVVNYMVASGKDPTRYSGNGAVWY